MHKEIIRVNLAGEKGACYLYAGHVWSLALANKQPSIDLVRMYEQEVSHLLMFQDVQKKYKVPATLFMPLWRILGWTLGAASAAKGESTAMSCIEAVEDVIQKHYHHQIQSLHHASQGTDPLLPILKKCYEDEAHHCDMASQHGPHSLLFQQAVKTVTRIAIWLSQRA